MAPGVTQVVFGGRFSPNVEESPARLWCQAPGEGQRQRLQKLQQLSWLSGGHRGPGSGMTHGEGGMDAEGCPSTNHHVTLQPGTEVKFGGS